MWNVQTTCCLPAATDSAANGVLGSPSLKGTSNSLALTIHDSTANRIGTDILPVLVLAAGKTERGKEVGNLIAAAITALANNPALITVIPAAEGTSTVSVLNDTVKLATVAAHTGHHITASPLITFPENNLAIHVSLTADWRDIVKNLPALDNVGVLDSQRGNLAISVLLQDSLDTSRFRNLLNLGTDVLHDSKTFRKIPTKAGTEGLTNLRGTVGHTDS